METIFFESFLL